nr:hypothetical protein [Tanacetum cinerariifolium]
MQLKQESTAFKAGEGNVQQYVLFLLWSSGSKDPQNTDDDVTFEVKEPESEVHVSSSSSAKTKKHDDKPKREAKGKSHVKLSTGIRNLSEEFEDFSDNSINEVNAVNTLVFAVGQISTNSTNTFSAACPSNTAVRPTLENLHMWTLLNTLMIQTCQLWKALLILMMKKLLEEVYVCQPPGFEDPDYPDKVYKGVKALYGLHQAPKDWYETLANYLLENGFRDQTLFIKRKKVKQKQDGIFISQDKYVAKILRKFGLIDGKLASTSIDTEKPLLKDPDGEDVDVHTYRSMIGSLMYLTSSRPDIMFAVCACARFQVTPKASHLHAVKRIFRYLKGKPHLGLWYPKDSPFNLVAYSDSDYAHASLDKKSTTRGFQFLGCKLISWQCKKQTIVATSSIKAEYVAAASCYA